MIWQTKEQAIEAHKLFNRNAVCHDSKALPRLLKVLRQIKHGSVVLDLGCNDGEFGKWLISKRGCTVYGVDVSDKVGQLAIENGVIFRHCDAAQIPFQSNMFDYVNASEFLEHIFDIDEVLVETKRVLKDGGIFLGTVPHPHIENLEQEDYHCRAFTKDSLRETLEKHFKIMDVSSIFTKPKGHGGIGQHLFFKVAKA